MPAVFSDTLFHYMNTASICRIDWGKSPVSCPCMCWAVISTHEDARFACPENKDFLVAVAWG